MPSYPDAPRPAPAPAPAAPQGPKPLHQMSFMELREYAKGQGDWQAMKVDEEIARRWRAAGADRIRHGPSPTDWANQMVAQETINFAKSDAERVQREQAPHIAQNEAAAAAAAEAAKPSTAGRDALTKFMNDMLNTGLSPNDPIYQGLAQLGRGVGRAQASAGGFNSDSGYARYMTQNQQRNSVLPYMQQRIQMGGQASQALAGLEQGDSQLAERARQFDAQHALNLQGFQNDVAKQNFAGEQNKNGMIGGIIGGALGAIPGIIGAIPTGGASLGLIGAGAGIGQSIGAGSTVAPRMIGPMKGFGDYNKNGSWS